MDEYLPGLRPAPGQRFQNSLDLVGIDDQWRRHHQRVAQCAQQHAVALQHGADLLGDLQFGGEGLAGVFVGHEFQRRHQADAPRLADQRVSCECLDAGLERRGDFANVADDVQLVIKVQGLQRYRSGNRVTAVGIAMAEAAEGLALVGDDLVDAVADQQCGNRLERRRQALGAGQHVRLDAHGLAAPVVSGAAETADDLVSDHQDVVLAQYRLDLGEVARRWNDHATGAHDRLGKERADGFRPGFDDGLFQLFGQTRGKCLFAFARQALAIQVRAAYMQHIGQWFAPAGVHVGQAGQAGCRQGGAVIAALAGDQAGLAGLADGGVVVAHELDRSIDRLRPRTLEHHLVQTCRCPCHQGLRQIGGRAVAAVGEGLLIGQLEHLGVAGFCQARLAEAQRRAPQAGHPLDETLAMFIEHVDALATLHDHRADLFVQTKVGLGVEMVGDIPLGQIRTASNHEVILSLWLYAYALRGFIFTSIFSCRQMFCVSHKKTLFRCNDRIN